MTIQIASNFESNSETDFESHDSWDWLWVIMIFMVIIIIIM